MKQVCKYMAVAWSMDVGKQHGENTVLDNMRHKRDVMAR